jgi:hypothetical protein
MAMALKILLAALSLSLQQAYAIPFSQYILAPSTRTVLPTAVFQSNGTVSSPESLLANATSSSGGLVLTGNAAVAYDFGINVGRLPARCVPVPHHRTQHYRRERERERDDLGPVRELHRHAELYGPKELHGVFP